MSDLVDGDLVERIVGVSRHPVTHYAKAVSSEQRVYILHSRHCVNTTADLRDCAYSKALDRGIDPDEWVEDVPTRVMVSWGDLVPYEPMETNR